MATTTIYPTGTTTPDDWSLAAGASKVAAVAAPDDDATSYIASGSTSGTYQYFTLTPGLSAADTVTAVSVRCRARRGGVSDATFRFGYIFSHSGGTQTSEITGQTAVTNWNDFTLSDTGLALTNVSGFQVWTRNTQTRNVHVTTLEVTITYTPGFTNYPESVTLGRGLTAAPVGVAGALGSLALGRGQTAAPGGPAATLGSLALGRGGAAGVTPVTAAMESLLAGVGRGLAVAALQPDGSATIEVAASGDDGAESTGGGVTLTTITLDTDSVGDITGFLFRGLSAPRLASIVTAYLEVYPNDSDRQSANVTIKAQANPANFAASSNNFSGRTMTTASASWVATNIGTGAYKASPSLAAVIQEVVNDAAWASGGDVAVFLIQNSASGWLRVASWDHTTDPPARLVVTWTSGAQAITETLTLDRSSAVTVSPVAALLADMALARALAVSEQDAATLAAALTLARGLGLSPAGLQAALGELALGRGQAVAEQSTAATAAAVTMARGLGLSPANVQAVLEAMALARGLGLSPSPAAGLTAALNLARALGLTAADGFTILEAVALGRALGVDATATMGAAAVVVLALARALAGDATAAAGGAVALGAGRTVTLTPVMAGQEAVALARGLGVEAVAGMALWESVALAVGRGLGAADTFGYLETIALERRVGLTAADAQAALEALTLALGSAMAVEAAVGTFEAVGLSRALDVTGADVAGLLESIGIGIYRAVRADATAHIILVTPRHVFIVDAENRVSVIELENRVRVVEVNDDE